MPLTHNQRQSIVALRAAGRNPSYIADRLGITRATVYRWIRRKEKEGHIERHPPRPRPRVTTAQQDAEIVATHSAAPFTPTRETATRYNVSLETVRRRLHAGELQNRRLVRKPLATQTYGEEKSQDGDTAEAAQPGGSQSRRRVDLSPKQTGEGPLTGSSKSKHQITQEIEKTEVTTDIDDKYDVLGKYVASKLRQLDIEQRMYVENIIHEAIYEGQMGHLNNNSQLVVDTETFDPSQSRGRKRMRLEIAEQKEYDPGNAVEIDIEERLENKDLVKKELFNLNSVSNEANIMNSQEAKEMSQPDSEDVPDIKIEIVTEEDEEFQESLSTEYIVTKTQPVTTRDASEFSNPHHAERKILLREEYMETHSEFQDSNVKTDIDGDPLDGV